MSRTPSCPPPTALLAAQKNDPQLKKRMCHHARTLAELEQAREFAPYVTASGPLHLYPDHCGEGGAYSVIEALGYAGVGAVQGEDIAAVYKRLNIAFPDDPQQETAVGLVSEAFDAGARAGYLLGLAVGQALGPDALKGGAK